MEEDQYCDFKFAGTEETNDGLVNIWECANCTRTQRVLGDFEPPHKFCSAFLKEADKK
jgi:hypothetical protein